MINITICNSATTIILLCNRYLIIIIENVTYKYQFVKNIDTRVYIISLSSRAGHIFKPGKNCNDNVQSQFVVGSSSCPTK